MIAINITGNTVHLPVGETNAFSFTVFDIGRPMGITILRSCSSSQSTQSRASPVRSEGEVPGKPLLALGVWRSHRGSFTLRRTACTERETGHPAVSCFAKGRGRHLKHQGGWLKGPPREVCVKGSLLLSPRFSSPCHGGLSVHQQLWGSQFTVKYKKQKTKQLRKSMAPSLNNKKKIIIQAWWGIRENKITFLSFSVFSLLVNFRIWHKHVLCTDVCFNTTKVSN